MFFIHEIVHIKSTGLRGFPTAWNLLCGFPFLLPYFIYDPHLEHHRTGSFATHDDPRYVPLAHGSRLGLVLPLVANIFLPLVIAFRFWLLGPISWMIGGRVREAVLRRASTLVMNPAYVRDAMTIAQRRAAVRQEVGCVLVWGAIFVLLAMGVIPWLMLPAWYLAAVAMVEYNYVRALVAHRYVNDGEHSVSFREQLLDSITIANPWSLALLIGPVGLRFHSLHHLFPSMPYHCLGRAHRRLIATLPAGHAYLLTLRGGVTPALYDLWKRCGRNRRAAITIATEKAHT